ncbi:MAG: FliO/MopB family protein [Candidatus Kapaibacterium sp.]
MDYTLIKAFFTLALGVAVMGGVLFLIKKYFVAKAGSPDAPDMKVISKLNLQPKVSLYMIKAGSKTLLIGVSDKGVNPITELDDDNIGPDEMIKYFSDDNPSYNQKTLKTAPEAGDADLSFMSFLKNALLKKNIN